MTFSVTIWWRDAKAKMEGVVALKIGARERREAEKKALAYVEKHLPWNEITIGEVERLSLER